LGTRIFTLWPGLTEKADIAGICIVRTSSETMVSGERIMIHAMTSDVRSRAAKMYLILAQKKLGSWFLSKRHFWNIFARSQVGIYFLCLLVRRKQLQMIQETSH
jgi:hypothetical protein